MTHLWRLLCNTRQTLTCCIWKFVQFVKSTKQFGLQTSAQDCTWCSQRTQCMPSLRHTDGRLLAHTKSHQLTRPEPSVLSFTAHQWQYKAIKMWQVWELPLLYMFVRKTGKKERPILNMKMQQAGQCYWKSEFAWLGLALSHKSTAKWAEIRYYGKWWPESFRPKFGCLAQKPSA